MIFMQNNLILGLNIKMFEKKAL